MNKKHAKALKFLCITILLLFGAPKINLKIGVIPFYLIDFFIFLTFYYARSLPKLNYKIPYKNLVSFIFFMIIINELFNGLRIGTLSQPIYLMIRMSLAISLFFTVPRIVRRPEDLIKILKYGLLGALITALLLIFSSLPMTRGISVIILSNLILTPDAVSLSTNILEYGDTGIRGHTLIGVSILSGAFLNVIWPLLILWHVFYKPKGFLKYLLFAVLFLVPIGVILTYSRGAYLALILILMGIVFFQKGKLRFLIFGFLTLLYISFSTIGFQSDLFVFERVSKRTIATFENPFEDERESERFFSYTQPFVHLSNNPTYFFLGEGFAGKKVANYKIVNRADHSVFSAGYYAYGLITSMSIVFLFFLLFFYTFKIVRKTTDNKFFSTKLTRFLFVILLGFSSWFSFGHAALSNPRGSMLMFFVFGLVVSQQNIYQFEQKKYLDSKKTKP